MNSLLAGIEGLSDGNRSPKGSFNDNVSLTLELESNAN